MGMIRLKKEVLEGWMSNKPTPPNTVKDIAKSIGVDQSLLYRIINAERQLTTNVLGKLCDLTGYQPGDLCIYDRTIEPEEDTEK